MPQGEVARIFYKNPGAPRRLSRGLLVSTVSFAPFSFDYRTPLSFFLVAPFCTNNAPFYALLHAPPARTNTMEEETANPVPSLPQSAYTRAYAAAEPG